MKITVEKKLKNKKDLRIMFMGTPEFAKESLKALVENGYNVVAVFSQPDKPKGRGMQLCKSAVKEYAETQNIPVYQPVKVRNNEEVLEQIKSIKPDLAVVVAYGKILPKEMLEIPEYGCINVHGSLLPKLRGSAPIQHSIINGDKETGITTMFMDAGMDTGDMLDKESLEISEKDTYGDVYLKLASLGKDALIKTLEKYAKGELEREKQGEEYTLAPPINKEDCVIDFSKAANKINCLVRGVNPSPCARCILENVEGNEIIYKIYEAVEVEYIEEKAYKCGEIIKANAKEGLLVKALNSYIQIVTLQAAGGKKMNAKDYLRGKEIKGRFKC
ncbi:MAG: methionyl-tRNA formyltransferase [Clostridia bacterium]